MKISAIVLFFLMLPMINVSLVHAVPKEVKARSEYMIADKYFNKKEYKAAIKHLEEAKSILGKSNQRIEYLLTKSYYNAKKYNKAMKAVDAFFELTPESESGSKAYNEMVEIYSHIRQKKKERLYTLGNSIPYKQESIQKLELELERHKLELKYQQMCLNDADLSEKARKFDNSNYDDWLYHRHKNNFYKARKPYTKPYQKEHQKIKNKAKKMGIYYFSAQSKDYNPCDKYKDTVKNSENLVVKRQKELEGLIKELEGLIREYDHYKK